MPESFIRLIKIDVEYTLNDYDGLRDREISYAYNPLSGQYYERDRSSDDIWYDVERDSLPRQVLDALDDLLTLRY